MSNAKGLAGPSIEERLAAAEARAEEEHAARVQLARDNVAIVADRVALASRLAEATRERDELRLDYHNCADVGRRLESRLTAALTERDAALARAESAEARLAEAEGVLREIADGDHGEYCGDRNAMLTQGGKSKCYADCPVNVARAFLAREVPHA